MKFLRIIVLALITILVITFALQNQELITHRYSLGLNLQFFTVGPYYVANIVLIAIVFLAGVIFSVLWGALYSFSQRAEVKRLKRVNSGLERQLAAMPSQKEPVNLTAAALAEGGEVPVHFKKGSEEDPFKSSGN